MKIDLKYIIVFITTSLFAILTWSLITLMDVKSNVDTIKGELTGVEKT
jgi:hypothetical protein